MKSKFGFTIVELLIVIVVIAILAAISIVAYNGIQNRANDTSIQNNLSAIARKYEIFKIDSPTNTYPYGVGGGANGLDNIATPVNKNAYDTTLAFNLLNCTNTALPGTDYALLATSKSGKRFWVGSSSGGVKEYTGSTAWTGGGTATICASVLVDSNGNGAGWGGGVWRSWVN